MSDLRTPEEKTTRLHISGPFNSARFTNCCGLAVHKESKCPGCGAKIVENRKVIS
jgi:hypothetical protein